MLSTFFGFSLAMISSERPTLARSWKAFHILTLTTAFATGQVFSELCDNLRCISIV